MKFDKIRDWSYKSNHFKSHFLFKYPNLFTKFYLSDFKFFFILNFWLDLNKYKFSLIGNYASTFQAFFYKQLPLQRVQHRRREDKFKFESHYLKNKFYFKNKMMRLFSYHSFWLNSHAITHALFSAFYYNFFVVAMHETGFTKDVVSVNFNSSYYDYSDLLNFFSLKTWIALKKYWRRKFFTIKNVVIIAADNHLINHLDKAKYFIVDFLTNSFYQTKNSITAYINVYDEFFAAVFIGFVYRFKMVGSNIRYFLYLNFYKRLYYIK